MVVRLFFVSAIAFCITAIGHYYIYLRLVNPLSHVFFVPGVSTLITLWSLTFFGFALVRAVPNAFRKFIELPMFVWMGIAYIILLLSVLTLPLDVYFRVTGNERGGELLAYALYFGTVALSLYSILKATRGESVIHVDIPVKDSLPEGIENISIAQLSDIHVAGLVGRRRMKRVAKRVNSLKPDLVFVTGDIVDGSVAQLKKEIMPLAEIKPRLGVYYVTGNHEYYCNAPKWKRFVEEKLGWKVLSNACETLSIEGLEVNILGIEDRAWLHYARKLGETKDVRLEHAATHLSELQKTQGLNLLLAHQPKDARHLANFPWIDVQFSGHTHGGQLWPLDVIVRRDQTYNKGLFRLRKNQHLYVHQGTGFWGPPFRLGSSSEITLIQFKRTNDSI